jgi:hypothetical protein
MMDLYYYYYFDYDAIKMKKAKKNIIIHLNFSTIMYQFYQ